MRRKETEELERRAVNFFKGDFGRLQDLHPRIGASKAVRMMVREHIRRAESKTETQTPNVPVEEIF